MSGYSVSVCDEEKERKEVVKKFATTTAAVAFPLAETHSVST